MKGNIVVVGAAFVVDSTANGERSLSYELVVGDGIVLRNDNATWHDISTELPSL